MKKDAVRQRNLLLIWGVLVLFVASFVLTGFHAKAATPVIVINPGHCVGIDPGAVNVRTGIQEAVLNAGVAAKTANKLRDMGYDVYLTHPVEGSDVPALLTFEEMKKNKASLKSIGNAVNKKNPALTLSIHHNSSASSAETNTGYEFYWSSYRDFDKEGVYEVPGLWSSGEMTFRDRSPSDVAMRSLQLAGILKDEFASYDLPYRDTIERDDYIPAHVKSPSVLVEAGFVSNDTESKLLATPEHQQATADRLAAAAVRALGTDFNAQAPYVGYTTHVENVGWQGIVGNGGMSGTEGRGLRLEGITINPALSGIDGALEYRTHVENVGWQGYVKNGAMSGTEGRGLRLEGISIQVTGELESRCDVYYQVHAQNFGWLGLAKNGGLSGTAGYGCRLEGIHIYLVEKGAPAPTPVSGSLAEPFFEKS